MKPGDTYTHKDEGTLVTPHQPYPDFTGLTGPTQVPYLTTETFMNALRIDQVRALAKGLSQEEKFTLMREWVKPLLEDAEKTVTYLTNLQEALR